MGATEQAHAAGIRPGVKVKVQTRTSPWDGYTGTVDSLDTGVVSISVLHSPAGINYYPPTDGGMFSFWHQDVRPVLAPVEVAEAVSWYDSADTSERRRVVRWQPSGLADGLGYILYATRQDPFDLWPTMGDGYAEAVPLFVARSFAAGYMVDGEPFSDNDPGRPTLRACPDPPADDPDDATAVTLNVTRAQARVILNLVEGLLTFAPDDDGLRFLRHQLNGVTDGRVS